MPPEIVIANAALLALEKLIPIIAQKFNAGEITAEQQAEVRARYAALRAQGDAAFTGPEWDITK